MGAVLMLLFYISIHTIAAFVLVIPSVFVPLFSWRIQSLKNLKRLFRVSNWLSKFSKIGGIILFISGIGIMWEAKIGFSKMWLNVSIVLVVILEIIAALIAPKKMKEIANYLLAYEGSEIPEHYRAMMKNVFPYNAIIHLITLAIMLLMIFKPF